MGILSAKLKWEDVGKALLILLGERCSPNTTSYFPLR